MKKNYKAWNINIENFFKITSDYEKKVFLIQFAILAPSSHNSQPWEFIIKEDKIFIYKSKKRDLPVGDADHRQSYISIGCAIENLLIAADYFGYESKMAIDGNTNAVCISLLEKNKSKVNKEKHQIFNILNRKVNRGEYTNDLINPSIINQIKNFSTADINISIIDDSQKKEKLANICLEATAVSMSDKFFRKEVSKYIINNKSKLGFGIPGFTMGFPDLLSFFAPYIVRFFNVSILSRKKDEGILKKATPYMVVISSKNDNINGWIEVGRVFQKISLFATSYKISIGVWAAPIQIGDFYKEIQKLINISYRPEMFFRMGYPIRDAKNSPRLDIREVIEPNVK